MKKTRKILLGIGTLAAIATPISAVVACSGDKKTDSTSTTPDQIPGKTQEGMKKSDGSFYTNSDLNIWIAGTNEADQPLSKMISSLETEGNFDSSKTKDDLKAAIGEAITDTSSKDLKAKKLLFMELADHYEKLEDTYYILKSLRGAVEAASTSLDMASMAVSNEYATNNSPKTKSEIMREIILSGELDINKIAMGIVNKFTPVGTKANETSKDERFNGTVILAAKFDNATRTLVVGQGFWEMGNKAMGGDDTVKYILEASGFHFQNNN